MPIIPNRFKSYIFGRKNNNAITSNKIVNNKIINNKIIKNVKTYTIYMHSKDGKIY